MLSVLNSISFQATATVCASAAQTVTINQSFVEGFLDEALQAETSRDLESYLRVIGPALSEIEEIPHAEEAQQLATKALQLSRQDPASGADLDEFVEFTHDFLGIIREQDSVEQDLPYIELLARNEAAMEILRSYEDDVLNTFSERAREAQYLINEQAAGSLRPGVCQSVQLIAGFAPQISTLLGLDDSLELHAAESIELLGSISSVSDQVEAIQAIYNRIHSALIMLGMTNPQQLELKLLEAHEIAEQLQRAAEELFRSLREAPQNQVDFDEDSISAPSIEDTSDDDDTYPLNAAASSSTSLGEIAGAELEAVRERIFGSTKRDFERDTDRTAQLVARLTESLEIFIASV